jgi:hypothetical protein
MTSTEKHPLTAIEGEQLSSVEFVQDYVQLRFDGPCLTAITRPTVKLGALQLEWGTTGYRDALCERIGNVVDSVSVKEKDGIHIKFRDGAIVSISLRPEEYRAGEAVIFTNGSQRWDVL